MKKLTLNIGLTGVGEVSPVAGAVGVAGALAAGEGAAAAAGTGDGAGGGEVAGSSCLPATASAEPSFDKEGRFLLRGSLLFEPASKASINSELSCNNAADIEDEKEQMF